jgi:hypothetical protein
VRNLIEEEGGVLGLVEDSTARSKAPLPVEHSLFT